MHEIALFVEDHAHQLFLEALITKLAREYGFQYQADWRNVRRGYGAVVNEFKQYLHDLQRDRAELPDLVVVATDANCKGINVRLKELRGVTEKFPIQIVYAVPDPHVERWLLLDSSAFKAVFGRGCNAPDQKCERARYKKLLIETILKTGITPSLGGIEFAADIVHEMDINRAEQNDHSFGLLLKELRAVFREWKT